MTNLHKKIKAIRKHRGLNQLEVAEQALLSLKTYQRIENGQKDPTDGEVGRIAEALGCSPHEIRHFDLENGQFSLLEKTSVYETLLTENQRLRHLVNRLLDMVFTQRGGQ